MLQPLERDWAQEWQWLQGIGGRLERTLAREAMWVYPELVACALWVIDPIGRRLDCYRVGEEDATKTSEVFKTSQSSQDSGQTQKGTLDLTAWMLCGIIQLSNIR